MAQNDLLVRLGLDSNNFDKSIQNTKKSITDLGSKSKNELADITDLFKKTSESTAPLGRKIKDIKKYMEELTTSGKTTTAEGQAMYQKLSQAAKQYDAQLRQIQQDTRGVAAESKKAGAGGGINLKDVGSGLLDKAGLGGVAGELGNISSVLNPTTAGVVALGGAVIGASKAFYDYNKELDRSLEKTAQFTGYSGNELNSLRNGIKSVADTFEKDYDEVLSGVDGLMAQFGIDGETALNLIRDGFIGGADDGGKMLDLISQYAGSFNDAGISASELIAILGNIRSGIFNEEGPALIQKASMNIRLMGDNTAASIDAIGLSSSQMFQEINSGSLSTVNAMKMISNRLKELNPQSKEVGEVLKNVFGKQGSQAGLELVKALSDVETDLDKVMEQTGEWGESLKRVQEADRNLENALQSLFGCSEMGWNEMENTLKTKIYQGLADVINYFIELYNNSIILRGSIAKIGFVFKTAWDIVKAILKQFATAIKGLSDMVSGLLELDWNKIANGWTTGMKGLFTNVSSIVKSIKENAEDAVDQTINGHIEVVQTVESKEDEGKKTKTGGSGSGSGSGGKGKGGKNKGGKSGKSSSKSKQSEKIDYLVSVDDNSLDTAEKKLSAWTSKKKSLNIDDKEAIEKCDKEIAKWTDEVKKRKLRLENLGIEPGSKADLENQIKKLEDNKNILFKTNADPADIQKVDNEIKSLKKKLEDEEIRLGLKPVIEAGSMSDIKKQIEEKEKEISLALNTNISPESMQKLQNELDELRKKEREKSIELGITKNSATISPNEDNWGRGSVQDKKQSLSNANSMVAEMQENYRLKLIGKDEVESQLSDINSKLQELGLKPITLTFNSDGTLTTAAEDLERFKGQMDSVSSTVGSMGSVFSSLGGAIGGTTGEVMNFVGTSISAIGQIIPQIISLITAKEAEAMAAGTASGAELPFPANIAAIASIIATLVGVFASLPKFESGGIVGGSSFTGDKLLARVNSGEMILNKNQQRNLYQSLASAEVGSGSNTLRGDVNFTISGSALKGTLKNYDSKMKKIK